MPARRRTPESPKTCEARSPAQGGTFRPRSPTKRRLERRGISNSDEAGGELAASPEARLAASSVPASGCSSGSQFVGERPEARCASRLAITSADQARLPRSRFPLTRCLGGITTSWRCRFTYSAPEFSREIRVVLVHVADGRPSQARDHPAADDPGATVSIGSANRLRRNRRLPRRIDSDVQVPSRPGAGARAPAPTRTTGTPAAIDEQVWERTMNRLRRIMLLLKVALAAVVARTVIDAPNCSAVSPER